jgi:hypothetical protein
MTHSAKSIYPTPEHETVLAAGATIEAAPLDNRNASPADMTPERTVLRLVAGDSDDASFPARPDSERDPYIFPVDNADRRKHRRFRVARPGKVFRRATQQYQSVESRDLSFSGALLSIVTLTPYREGEIVDVGIALTKNSVMPSKSLVQGVVVRASEIDHGRQEVAIRYIQPSTLQQAA